MKINEVNNQDSILNINFNKTKSLGQDLNNLIQQHFGNISNDDIKGILRKWLLEDGTDEKRNDLFRFAINYYNKYGSFDSIGYWGLAVINNIYASSTDTINDDIIDNFKDNFNILYDEQLYKNRSQYEIEDLLQIYKDTVRGYYNKNITGNKDNNKVARLLYKATNVSDINLDTKKLAKILFYGNLADIVYKDSYRLVQNTQNLNTLKDIQKVLSSLSANIQTNKINFGNRIKNADKASKFINDNEENKAILNKLARLNDDDVRDIIVTLRNGLNKQ